MDILSQIIVDNLLSVILLVVGFVLLVIEMYVPGFGAFGISGCVLLIGGIIAARPTPLQALIMVVIILALLCIVLSVSIHSASKGRLSKSKLVLKDVSIEHAEADDLAYFVDKKGVAVTVLRPAGMARFARGRQPDCGCEGGSVARREFCFSPPRRGGGWNNNG